MNAQRHQRISELFEAVCDLPEDAQCARLERECADDVDLRCAVEALLLRDRDPNGLLDESALRAGFELRSPASPDATTTPTLRIGHYRLLRLIGVGGMGTVFEAEQDHPRRTVALKIIRPGIASTAMLRRFDQEADILGRLLHPGIAQIHEAGIGEVHLDASPAAAASRNDALSALQVRSLLHAGLQPFFAMEFVRGLPLNTYADRQKLGTKQRMELMAHVCDAVHHAHLRSVIHRDLKPANILVTDEGQPKILDFGVARAMDADVQTVTTQTDMGQLMGTVPYMSPEQVSGASRQIDVRTDVYTLGVVLYELLAGRLPYDVTNRSFPEAFQVIREHQPSSLSSINRIFRGDIEAIVAKALDKDRRSRYGSAADFAADIRRYLSGQPLVARPPSAFYHLRKFARRNRALVAGGVATLASLLVGLAGIFWFAIRESRARAVAERMAYRVTVAAAGDAIQHWSLGQARNLLQEIPPDERKWEWQYLWNQLDNSYLSLEEQNHRISNLRFSPDTPTLVAETYGPPVQWDLRTGAMTRLLPGDPNRPSAVSLDLTHAAVLEDDGDILLVDLRSGRSTRLSSEGIRNGVVALGPDGNRIAVGGEDGQVRVLSEAGDEKPFSTRVAGTVRSMHFAPVRSLLAIQTSEQSIVLDFDSGEVLGKIEIEDSHVPNLYAWLHDGSQVFWHRLNPSERRVQSYRIDSRRPTEISGLTEVLTALTVSADDKYILGTQSDGKIYMWETKSAELVRTFHCPNSGTFGFAIDPDTRVIAAGDTSGLIRVFDVASGGEIGVLRGLTTNIVAIAFNNDGSTIAAGTIDGRARLWRSDAVFDSSVLRGHTSYVYPVAFSPDGTIVASGSWDLTVRLWDAATGREMNVMRGHGTELQWVSFSPDGRRLLSFSSARGDSPNLIVWDVETGHNIAQTWHAAHGGARPVFDSSGDRIWLAGAGDTANLWHFATNVVTSEPLSVLRNVKSPWITSDGETMARFAGDQVRLELVDISTGRVRHTLCPHATRAAFSPDDKVVAGVSHPFEPSGRGDVIGIWLVQTGELLGELRHEGGEIYDVAFSPDGARIATCGRDKLIHIWDAKTLEAIVGLRSHTDYIWSIAWNPDGSRLVSGSGDSTIRLWSTSRPFNPR